MNYIYSITDRENNDLFIEMIKSLNKYCDFILLLNCFEENKQLINFCNECLSGKFIVKNIEKQKWDNRRMCYKIENINSFDFKEGDRIFVLDDDLIIQDDIFSIFDSNFDICITSRHYEYWYKINAGVWGIKWNEKSKNFLNFYISQINNPTWDCLINFRKKFKRNDSLDWWVDQDFLCVVYENNLPFECKILDIGSKYNFCPSVEESIPETFIKSKKEILSVVGNKNIKIIHLKGRLKNIIKEICV